MERLLRKGGTPCPGQDPGEQQRPGRARAVRRRGLCWGRCLRAAAGPGGAPGEDSPGEGRDGGGGGPHEAATYLPFS